MERLTIRNSDGTVSQPMDLKWAEALKLLADYEDTGLTPKEVRELFDDAKEMFMELKRCKEAKHNGKLMALPCKMGDEVWGIRRCGVSKGPRLGEVSEMFFSDDMRLIVAVKHVCRGEWGAKVFRTREEAEAALKGTVSHGTK